MGDVNDPFMRNQNAAVQARTKAQNRSSVLQLKLMGQSHPTGLTPNLLKLFEPRQPLEFLPPPQKRKCPPYSGIAPFVSHFAEPGDPEYAPPKPQVESPLCTKKEREFISHDWRKGLKRLLRIYTTMIRIMIPMLLEIHTRHFLLQDLQVPLPVEITIVDWCVCVFYGLYAPLVFLQNYETSESKIKREFEAFGPIKKVCRFEHSPTGYAFIEYLNTRDMKAAYKQGDGKKIDGRRVLVDVERGRTVGNWRPRRLGGGLGTSRVPGEKIAGEEEQPLQGRSSRSEEPRPREDREKSRDRGKEREREQSHERSRERSYERSRERSCDRTRESHREEKHNRDRDRGRDRDGERESRRDRGDRDRRTRDQDRERSRGREREYEDDGGRSSEREREYERGRSKQRRGESEEGHGYNEGRRRTSHYEHEEGGGGEQDRYDKYGERYGRMEEEEYRYDDRE